MPCILVYLGCVNAYFDMHASCYRELALIKLQNSTYLYCACCMSYLKPQMHAEAFKYCSQSTYFSSTAKSNTEQKKEVALTMEVEMVELTTTAHAMTLSEKIA